MENQLSPIYLASEKNIAIGESSIKLLGITIDNKLNFNEHVTNICKKANQTLHALARFAKCIDSNNRVIMKTSHSTTIVRSLGCFTRGN